MPFNREQSVCLCVPHMASSIGHISYRYLRANNPKWARNKRSCYTLPLFFPVVPENTYHPPSALAWHSLYAASAGADLVTARPGPVASSWASLCGGAPPSSVACHFPLRGGTRNANLISTPCQSSEALPQCIQIMEWLSGLVPLTEK